MRNILFLFSFFLLMISINAQAHTGHGYKIGEEIKMECKNRFDKWEGGIICQESGKPISFLFGLDAFHHCAWHIKDEDEYKWIISLVKQDQSYQCRIKMVPQHEFFIPFEIPIWGVLENSDHIHLDNHLNIIFHVEDGNILGVAAYPVRDRFAYIKPGTIINLHGIVKWFQGASFVPLNSSHSFSSASFPYVLVFLWCVLTIVACLLCGVVVYRSFLKPRLISKFIKKD
eukprot:TRINITY_DN17602_c0_g1_i1.p1 TRINITY_DN17602_c0_g1~~TRINITY_DN17602_c0_g1_i1.p1  ORF type:complete len:229 (-),score=43.82 TRINITY_DN17602_c0_g1_i1:75-761(-)